MEEKKQWTGKSRGGSFGHRFFVYLIRIFGVRAAYVLMACIVVYFIPFAPKATKYIWQYNRKRRKLGLFMSAMEIYANYYVFGQILIDRLAMSAGMTDKYNFKFINDDRINELVRGKDGIIFIGGHVGNWQAGMGFFNGFKKRMNVVMLDAEHAAIKKVHESNNEQSDEYFRLIPLGQDAVGAMVQINSAIDNGECVCFTADRFLGRKGTRSMEFLGKKALFSTGPFKVASKYGVPIFFFYAMREPHLTYRLVFEEVEQSGKNAWEELLVRYTKSLEGIVRAYPRQWFNYYDFWAGADDDAPAK